MAPTPCALPTAKLVSTQSGASDNVDTRASQNKSESEENSGAANAGLELQFTGSRCYLSLEDLYRFQHSTEQRLWKAHSELELTDKDLSQALGRAIQQFRELTDYTASIVNKYGTIVQMFPPDAQWNRDGFKLQNHEDVHSLQSMVSQMVTDGKVVRTCYINVMETIMYVTTCTQLEVDIYDVNEVDSQCIQRLLLESALQGLRSVCTVLQDPSDFWLVFHMAELDFNSIDEALRKLMHTGCTNANTAARAQICSALTMISQQCLPAVMYSQAACQTYPQAACQRTVDHSWPPTMHPQAACQTTVDASGLVMSF